MSELTDEQIRYMTERFLSWKLPENFNPDGGISAQRPNYAPNVAWTLSGTNLFDYSQAEAMVCHMAEGMPSKRRFSVLSNDPLGRRAKTRLPND